MTLVLTDNITIRIENNELSFYFILFLFSLIFLLEYKTKKTKCDTVTEVTHSHNTKKGIEDSGTR